MIKKKIYQLDAFTSTPFTGNPAGVVPDASGLSDSQMLKIAKEMRLSETAFVFSGEDDYDFEVRFFTPTEEVDLCGHASIATFTLLKALGLLPQTKDAFIQKTKAGKLAVRFDEDRVLMKQAQPRQIDKTFTISNLCQVMNIQPSQMGLTLEGSNIHLMPEIWSTGLKDLLLPVQSLDDLKSLTPDMPALADFSKDLDIVGVHAFTLDKGQVWCRNFAPAFGIPEESATGTSNGALGAYLHHHQGLSGQTLTFTAHQGDWMDSPSRIYVHLDDTSSLEVWVGGQAVVVIEGEIFVE